MSHDKKMNPARAHKLDDAGRKKELPPEIVIDLVQPFAGMTLADIGAGTGFCTLALAEALAGDGRIYALDAQEEVLALLRAKLDTHPYGATIEPVLTPDHAPALPDVSVDVVLCCNVYHELDEQVAYLRELRRVLKPNGRLVIIDWQPLSPGAHRIKGPPESHRVGVNTVMAHLAAAGFFAIEPHAVFPLHWAVTAKKSSGS